MSTEHTTTDRAASPRPAAAGPAPDAGPWDTGGPAEDLAAAALVLARHFAAGATMWCVSPQWPAHARHVAVEFVHPVIVGTRALPAVSIDASTAAETVRLLGRPGDVLLVIGTSHDPVVLDLVARADAWGLTSIWLGAGARRAPAKPGADDPGHPGRAAHAVWLHGTAADVAARRGDLVLLYHLLWELTHIVFEHPGLLSPSLPDCSGETCITCSDEGRVAEVRRVAEGGQLEVLAGGRSEQVDGRLVGDLRPGDLVLVHAGVAVTSLDAARG